MLRREGKGRGEKREERGAQEKSSIRRRAEWSQDVRNEEQRGKEGKKAVIQGRRMRV